MGDEYEKRLFWRFLHHLQKPVGSLLIHLFREIEYHGLISVSHSRKRKLRYYRLRFRYSDKSVLALYAYGLLQVRLPEIRICNGKLPPILYIRLRCGLVIGSLQAFIDREDEMDIRMDELRHLTA